MVEGARNGVFADVLMTVAFSFSRFSFSLSQSHSHLLSIKRASLWKEQRCEKKGIISLIS